MNKLKPCPFCGSEDLRSVQLYESNDEHYIACNECNSHGDDGLTLLHAIKNWNKRAKQHCTQCKSKKENPWCSSCREKDCEVSSDGTCEMIRRYLKPRCVHCKVSEQNLDLIAEVERLKSELHQIKTDNNLYQVKCMNDKCEFVKGTDRDCSHSKPHKFIPGVCDDDGCNDGCKVVTK